MTSPIICNIHGKQKCSSVSPGVYCVFEGKKTNNNIVCLILLLEGELDEWLDEWLDEKGDEKSRTDLKLILYFSRSYYVKKEELNVFPLTGSLSKKENKYEYVMIFKDEQSIKEACSIFRAVCTKCFAEFVSNNPEIIYPYWVEDIPESW